MLEVWSRKFETLYKQRTHFPLSFHTRTCFLLLFLSSTVTDSMPAKYPRKKKQHKESSTQRHLYSNSTMALFNAYRVVVSSPITPIFTSNTALSKSSAPTRGCNTVRVTESALRCSFLLDLVHLLSNPSFYTPDQHYNPKQHVLKHGRPVCGRSDPETALQPYWRGSHGQLDRLRVRSHCLCIYLAC